MPVLVPVGPCYSIYLFIYSNPTNANILPCSLFFLQTLLSVSESESFLRSLVRPLLLIASCV